MGSRESYLIALGVAQVIGLLLVVLYRKKVSKKNSLITCENRLIAEERAMKKIAEELHDNLAPSLLLIRLQLEQYSKQNRSSALLACIDNIDTTLEQTRQMAALLHPATLSQLGLLQATKNLLQQLRQCRNIKTTLTIDASSIKIEPEKEVPLFRIIQESIQNMLKHARATEVSIRFRNHPQCICIDIQDNGIGFDINRAQTGSGLHNMQQRTLSLQGQFTLESKPGHGTHIHLQIPK